MQEELHEITGCEVCGNEALSSVLNLGLHPLCDDLVPINDSRECREYPIEILYCDICRTAHQRFQVAKEKLFPMSYHYRARFTADVLSGMRELVTSCERRFGTLAGKVVIDIGCNDGSLLDFFQERGAITLGIEPTAASLEAQGKGHVTFNNFLSPELAESIAASRGLPDVITFTNVFAHIENLSSVLKAVKKLMAPHTVLVIENHYLGAVLDGNQFDTFYHEHPRTYSYTSFLHIARLLDVCVASVEFPARYGGNIRVFLAPSSAAETQSPENHIIQKEKEFPEKFALMRRRVDLWRKAKRSILDRKIAKFGKLRAKAFPGRSAILVKLLGLDENSIEAVYEKPGSMKIGHYLPGTRIPIVSDDDLFATENQDAPLLNLAWHIPGEIRTYMAQRGYTGELIDIVSAEDIGEAV